MTRSLQLDVTEEQHHCVNEDNLGLDFCLSVILKKQTFVMGVQALVLEIRLAAWVNSCLFSYMTSLFCA